ncbi:RidA family protein [Mesorhizobium sp. B2-9-1]|uniref:RidA family protein n=1 Tax=unclassified Mesorhizobium TaxID=325217 RepID=UPI00112D4F99|nr:MULTISPECIES: RidA family protein [unclassified Mesorhizobium]TPI46246.1 RidA family protein [Mesorhizobium sp. B2-9-1]TPJ30723.1 RidA family protein [Mesorhizobium sp. B2-7-2]
MTIERLNPQGMHSNPAYSQGVSLPASARIVLVGGQNGVDAEGNIVGKGDLAAQTTQALANLAKVLQAGGATLENLVSLSVYIVGDQDIAPGFGAWMAFWANRAPPPIIKALRVVGLGNPDFLIEIEGQAAIA